MASKNSKHDSPHPTAQPATGRTPPLHLAVMVAAVIVVAGIAYVLFTQPPGTGSNGHPVLTVAPTNSMGNSTIPSQALLTGNASCVVGGKAQVYLVTDPYCPACAAIEPEVNTFYNKYKDKADIQYLIVATHSRSLAPTYGVDTVFAAHDYFVCAQEQGKIQEYKTCFYSQLTIQNGEYIPETKTQLQTCATNVKLDQTTLDACLSGARAKVDAFDAEAAGLLGSPFSTPSSIINCQYKVHTAYVERTYCAVTHSC